MVSTVASQQEGPGFNSRVGWGLSEWSLYVLSVLGWVSSGKSGFPHHQKHAGRPLVATADKDNEGIIICTVPLNRYFSLSCRTNEFMVSASDQGSFLKLH